MINEKESEVHQARLVLIYGCITKYTNFTSDVIVTHRRVEVELHLFLNIRFKPQSLYVRKIFWYPFKRTLCGSERPSGPFREEKNKFPCSHIRSQFTCKNYVFCAIYC